MSVQWGWGGKKGKHRVVCDWGAGKLGECARGGCAREWVCKGMSVQWGWGGKKGKHRVVWGGWGAGKVGGVQGVGVRGVNV